jgi:UDP-glucose 6-dehydrogenase
VARSTLTPGVVAFLSDFSVVDRIIDYLKLTFVADKPLLDLDLKKIKDVMANPIIIDGRNIYDAERVKKLGFEYYSIGRK